MDYLSLLKRTDYYEITGNKMTSYCTTLGGGSINYWDGKRVSFDSYAPLCDLTAFVQVLDKKHGINLVHEMYHFWRPDKVINKFHSHNRSYIEEEKTIYNDTFVSRMAFHSEGPTDLVVRITGAVNEGSKLEFKNNMLIIEQIYKTDRIAARVCKIEESRIFKVLGFNAGTRCKLEKRKYTLEFPVALKAGVEQVHTEKQIFTLAVSAAESRKEAIARFKAAQNNPQRLFALRKREWKDYFERNVPKFDCDNQIISKMYYFISYMIKSNIYRYGKDYFKNDFEGTGKYRLLAQWFWDSAFGAMNEKWLNGMPLPKSSMSNTLQSQREDGLLPFALCLSQYNYGHQEIIQPFILPMAVWDYYLKSGDREFIRTSLPVLVKFDEWMMKNRDANREELVNLKIPGESGWDNSKRYILHKHLVQAESPMLKKKAYVQSPDFNTYVYIGRKLMARMARELGQNDLAIQCEKKAGRTKAGIKDMWNDKTGLFMDRFEKGHAEIRVKTPGGVIPMLSGIPDRHKTSKIVKNLTNPKLFWTKYPVTTLDLREPDYNDTDEYQSYWNGRVWPNINWLIVEGLCRAGQYATARELIKLSFRMCNATGEPWCMENYHPQTGYPYFTHNIFNYIWGGLFNDMLLRRVAGIQGNAPKNEVTINPLFNGDLDRLAVEGIRIGTHSIGVRLQKDGTHIRLVFSHKGKKPITLITSLDRRKVWNATVTMKITCFDSPHWLEM